MPQVSVRIILLVGVYEVYLQRCEDV